MRTRYVIKLSNGFYVASSSHPFAYNTTSNRMAADYSTRKAEMLEYLRGLRLWLKEQNLTAEVASFEA